ncbi:hypothetical protein [Nitrosopumilus spindle-shaped virus]|uniref:Uncharacterized protein n=1 Tax=Nitrosopumilus spindle-shaped virus TaxID=2508184 RepID=A0A514K5C8_9VIRU|nr:hypothetical protein [Nitrosopumilus spindle-shaped virus]
MSENFCDHCETKLDEENSSGDYDNLCIGCQIGEF